MKVDIDNEVMPLNPTNLHNGFLDEMNETLGTLETNEVDNTNNHNKKHSKPPKARNALFVKKNIVTTHAQEKISRKKNTNKKGVGIRFLSKP